MRKLGYTRTGLVVPELNNRISGYQWSAGALEWQRNLSPELHCKPFVPDGNAAEIAFRAWVEAQRPDSMVVYKLPVKTWLARIGMRIPEDIGVAYLFRDEEEAQRAAGIDGNLPMVGAASVDLVVEGMSAHRSGFPQHPKEVLIMGDWRAGDTVVAN